jgi:hypothetical protein
MRVDYIHCENPVSAAIVAHSLAVTQACSNISISHGMHTQEIKRTA